MGVQTPLHKGSFEGKMAAHCKVLGPSGVSCAKMAEPIAMLFGVWTRVDARKHELGGVHIGSDIGDTWRIRLSRPCAAVIQPFCQIILTTYCNSALSLVAHRGSGGEVTEDT